MSQNNLVIYDDSVIKLSINQGTEDQRTSASLGSFTMGELVSVRDNARVFMGDCQNNKNTDGSAHETVGGVLVGNKYLGLIDSKPIIGFGNSSEPLNYTTSTTPSKIENTEVKVDEWTEKALLGSDSKLKLQFPENKDWPRENRYNPEYNAYNGDFMYDVFANALILFDDNISITKNVPRYLFRDENNVLREFFETSEGKRYVSDPTYSHDSNGKFICPVYKTGRVLQSDGTLSATTTIEEMASGQSYEDYYKERKDALLSMKRRTPIANYSRTPENKTYGDGYVVIRNVEPDNITTRFKSKSLDQYSGENPSLDKNYSHNLIEVFNVPVAAFASDNKFNPDHFTVSAANISLNKTLTGIDKLVPSKAGGVLSISNNLQLGNTTYLFTNSLMNYTPEFEFVLRKTGNNSYEVGLEKKGNDYVYLGDGLTTKSGSNSYKINSSNLITTDGIGSNDESLASPLGGGKSDYAYVGNIGYANGIAKIIDEYDESYLTTVSNVANTFENKNRKYNYLVNPVPICWMDSEYRLWDDRGYSFNESFDTRVSWGSNITDNCASRAGLNMIAEYVVNPYVFCNRKRVLMSGSSAGVPAQANRHAWDNALQVLGNNSYLNLTESNITASDASDKFFIEGFISDTDDYTITSTNRTKMFKSLQTLIKNEVPTVNDYDDLENEEVTINGYPTSVFSFTATRENGVITLSPIETSGNLTTIENLKIIYSPNTEVDLQSMVKNDITSWVAAGKTGKYRIEIIEQNSTETIENYSISLYSSSLLMMNSSTTQDIPIKITYDVHETIDTEPSEVIINSKVINLNDISDYTLSLSNYTEPAEKYEYGTIKKVETFKLSNNAFVSDKTLSTEQINNLFTSTTDKTINISKLSSYQYVLIKYHTGSSTTESADDVSFGYDFYQITSDKGVKINKVDYHVPTIVKGSVYTAKNTYVSGSIDESLSGNAEDTVILPTHAQAVLLEITHLTENNEMVGVFTAKRFSDLKSDTSNGISCAEYNANGTPNNSSTNNIHNNTYLKRESTSSFYTNDGKGTYYRVNPTLTPSGTPSIFAPNVNEKVLMLSSVSETRIVEVPLIRDEVLGTPKFNLRLANIKSKVPRTRVDGGSWTMANNAFHIRIIGYIS